MRASIASLERSRLLLFHKAPVTVVLVRVEFDEEEDYLIRQYKLHDHVLIARKPTFTYDEIDGRKVRDEIDNNIRVSSIFRQDAEFEMPHPAAAKAFIAEFREALTDFKNFLISNGAQPDPVMFDV